MGKVLRLSESKLKGIINKVLNEMKDIKADPNADKEFRKLIDNYNNKNCVPVFQQGTLTGLKCKDNTYYQIHHYRKFGQ